MPTKSRSSSRGHASSPLDDFGLKGQTVLVTGACGQLGFQFCKTLGQVHAKVFVSDLKPDDCRKQVDRLRKMDIEADSVAMDVSDPDSVGKAFQQIERRGKGLDVLVNAAATVVFTPFEDRSYEDFMRVLEVNVGGVFLCSQQATRLMKRQDSGGRIINIASIYGVVSSDPRIYTDCNRRCSEVYSCSKAAVIMLTRYLAVHLAPYKIRVNAISPGGVYHHQGSDFVKNYSHRTALGRMAEEDEINHSLLYLASNASSYVTGHNLVVDGGLTAW